MNKTAYHIARVALAINFLWVGILIFQSPEAWGGLIQPWALNLLPVPLKTAMLSTAVLDIVIGFFLLIDVLIWVAAALGAMHLIIVLATTGITTITVRDIGLLGATLALFVSTAPKIKDRK
ncbi:hypothetical protein HY604_00115 [Candidatus Peregrinibacteria bacterium]|nr:hypothetical protein [Candidatus Peregrinibacteria bacterium]